MLASALIEQLKAAVEEHGDYEVMDETESLIDDIEYNQEDDDEGSDPVFILTT